MPLHSSGLICSFTVVNDNFAALECSEHCDFDVIIVREGANNISNMKNNLSTLNMIKILRSIGVTTPFIFLHETDTEKFASYEHIQYLNSTYTSVYHSSLRKPFTSSELCESVYRATISHSILTLKASDDVIGAARVTEEDNNVKSGQQNDSSDINLYGIDLNDLHLMLNIENNKVYIP